MSESVSVVMGVDTMAGWLLAAGCWTVVWMAWERLQDFVRIPRASSCPALPWSQTWFSYLTSSRSLRNDWFSPLPHSLTHLLACYRRILATDPAGAGCSGLSRGVRTQLRVRGLRKLGGLQVRHIRTHIYIYINISRNISINYMYLYIHVYFKYMHILVYKLT